MLCILAKNCTETAYTRLVEALCSEHHIQLLKVCPCYFESTLLIIHSRSAKSSP